MLISKFNRIIRSRIVWTILGGIFALSLVVFIGPGTGSCSPTADIGPVEGTINGKPVSTHDFRLARFFELRMKEPSSLTDEAQARLRQRTWARLAALRAAEDMGVTVSDDEIASMIQRDPAFADKNGTFSKAAYEYVIREQLHETVETFEMFLRQDMTLRKMHQLLQCAVWSPAAEITSKLTAMTDRITAQGAVLRREQLVPPPTPTQEDAMQVFQDRPDMFRIPDKRAVKYVRFPIASGEQTLPTDEDVRAYYYRNTEKYSTTGTNGPVSIPIDDVRAEIVSNLQHRAASSAAYDKAMEFVIALQPDRSGRAPRSFDALAAVEQLQVHTSRLFSAHERLPEFMAGQDFAKWAFRLDPESRDQAISNPVIGTNDVYVMTLQTNVASRLPEFSEVKDRAMRLARDRRQSELFQAKCAEIRKAASEATASGKTLDEALAPYHVAVTNYPAFSIYNPGEEEASFEHSDEVKAAVISLRKGEVSDLVPLEGDQLLVFVKDRKPGDFLQAEMLRPELTMRINSYRANLVFSDWQDFLLRPGMLDDRAVRTRERSGNTSDEP